MDENELDDLKLCADNVGAHVYEDPDAKTWQENYTGPKMNRKQLKKRIKDLDQFFAEEDAGLASGLDFST